jgi:ABC-type transporter Mla MlaB component/anti-sigma regulatory factor (Ser/Thr protein kinase)
MSDTFEIVEGNLSAQSVDNVLARLDAFCKNATGQTITLDLSNLGFVDPYGMALLCLIGRPAVENESLIEVCEISGRTDVENALTRVELRVVSILEGELNYSVREITWFKNVIAELCHNIVDHSGDRGYLAAQRYTNHKQDRKFAVISVCDLGIGIRESLAARYDVSSWSHGMAISNAVKKTFSRDTARGLGLYVVRTICDDCDGTLHIRSGDSRVYFRGNRSKVYNSGKFPGSQISITLYERE